MFTVEMGRTLDGLHAALDENPDDWDTRRVIGDLYEEAGLVEEAQAWRWMTEERKRPSWDGRSRTWDWWADSEGDFKVESYARFRPIEMSAVLELSLLRTIPKRRPDEPNGNGNSTLGLRESRTRREAEEKLVAAWVKWGRGGE